MLRVNDKGRRFFNESMYMDFTTIANAILAQVGTFALFDQAWLDSCLLYTSVDDLAVHKVAGEQHLVGLQVAEADVVGVHRQRDAVVVEGRCV